MKISCCTITSGFACFLALTSLSAPLHAHGAWHSDQATHLIGLAGVTPKAKGSLSLSPTALIFTTPAGHTSIDRASLLTVTAGDLRVETGGTAGRISRAVIPFGGGSALATVTNKQVGLLTIEYRDERSALHGAVFLLPKSEAEEAQQDFGSLEERTQVEQPHAACQPGGAAHPHSIKVLSFATPGEAVPAEYRVLLYEQMLQRLTEQGTFEGVYRDGDTSPEAACAEYTFRLTLNAFSKGNAALRASTGPVGFFLGATSLKFHAMLQGLDGTTLLDQDFKVSKRGDTESLDVTDKIARSLTKKLKKAAIGAAMS